ncbi:flagellar hook assembly protein FlgD [Aurantimonas sp. Leaf443]|uniref:flagellar hook assembly protein FlgD n=1 Tax=Aurantimonas sp. Leaf443 TaxID=1736378 RepID=UPI0006FD239E|nr:flagellar hook assembly protein FlgD [Aurantimonas sp. Leaf443]KQT82450.1 hypothetical protein ASG48_15360 [Aurantimonas sp. Leaf443]
MSTISTVGATTASAAATSSQSTKDAAAASLDYNSFLKLLVAQMQNQDPLNPTDPTEQLSQLASFSNVEQSIKLNQKLEAMVASSAIDQGSAVIGRKLMTTDGTISGTVKSVTIVEGVATALLDNGKQITLGNGVSISE